MSVSGAIEVAAENRTLTRSTQIVLLGGQPVVRAGIRAAVADEPDLCLVGAATGEAQLWALIGPGGPDVVVLDLVDHGQFGLNLCLEITRQPDAPAVVLRSEAAVERTAVAATIAGAAAVVGRECPIGGLIEVIRVIARDPVSRPRVSLDSRRRAAARLDREDLPIFSMRMAGESPAEIGRVLGLSPASMAVRLALMLDRLSPVEVAG